MGRSAPVTGIERPLEKKVRGTRYELDEKTEKAGSDCADS